MISDDNIKHEIVVSKHTYCYICSQDDLHVRKSFVIELKFKEYPAICTKYDIRRLGISYDK